MNTLSWILYFADVLQSISRFVGFVSMMCLLSAALHVGITAGFGSDEGVPFKEYAARNPFLWPHIYAAVAFFVLNMVTLLIPSKDTIYAIAVSEMGQKAVESELGKKAADAIEMWINKQVAPAKKGE